MTDPELEALLDEEERISRADRYRPQVGDRVRRPDWGNGVYVDVTAVGSSHFLAITGSGFEHAYDIERMGWVKVEPRPELPDLPERWAVIHGFTHGARASLPYYMSVERLREAQDQMRRGNPDYPPDLAYVRYVPDVASIVWADDLDGGA